MHSKFFPKPGYEDMKSRLGRTKSAAINSTFQNR